MKIAAMKIMPAFALLLALGACQKGTEPEKGAAKAAGGEVLPGSVSDAMIDLDGATGTPPLQPAPEPKASAAAPEAAASEEATAAPAVETPAVPAAPTAQ